MSTLSAVPAEPVLHHSRVHDSADKHVSGSAEYADDIVLPEGALHAYLVLADHAHAQIVSIDMSAVEAAPGVIGVLGPNDVPGVNDISSTGRHDEPVFAEDEVHFHCQPLFAVVALVLMAVVIYFRFLA